MKNLLLALLALSLLPLIAGCSSAGAGDARSDGDSSRRSGAVTEPDNGPIVLIAVLDETASFHNHWQESVDKAAQAVAKLWPGDAVLVLGLDNHAWDEDDVRIPLSVLPNGALRAVQAKARLVAEVRALTPRPSSSGCLLNGRLRGKPPGTDTIGIVDMAGSLATQASGRTVHLAVFSDFEDEPVRNTGASNEAITFPPNTHFTALYVRPHGHHYVQKRIDEWVGIMNRMHVSCSADNFHLASDSAQVPLGREASFQ